jgi:DNA-binding response OmpR family regulator
MTNATISVCSFYVAARNLYGGLRHKLAADPARPKLLLTETGVGYRLACD